MTRPHITLWNTGPQTDWYEVRQASVKRKFLDESLNRHGYHCTPMTSANTYGWEIVLPQDVEVVWDGISDTFPDHVKVLKGQYLPSGTELVHTSTANATVAFNLHCFIETDSDHVTLLSGAPNYFLNGAKPMSALIRSDVWHFTPIQFCWRLTTPNKPVLFEKGMPIAFITNHPIKLIQDTVLNIKQADKRILSESEEYANLRQSRYDEFNGKNYPMLYKKFKNKNGILEAVNIKIFPNKPNIDC